MTWSEHHSESERLAAAAETASRGADLQQAESLYRQAAEAEVRALNDLDRTKTRTLGVTAVSTVALWYKARDLALAERLAHLWLSTPDLPRFAVDQLQMILQTIWNDRVRADSPVRFTGDEVIVSVKGGEIVTGGAPLDLIMRRVETVQAIFYRTAELLMGVAHRKRGTPSEDIQDVCRPWLFQTVPGSYQFVVAIEEPRQHDLFETKRPKGREIAQAFVEILKAAVEAPEEMLPSVVPDAEYRRTFLSLARSLAPTGEHFSELEIKSVDPRSRPIALSSSSRSYMGEVLKRYKPPPRDAVDQVQLVGVLRALHLDEDWLEIVTAEPNATRVFGAGDTVDDVIGPMVNKRVIVDTAVDRRARHTLRDIQLAE